MQSITFRGKVLRIRADRRSKHVPFTPVPIEAGDDKGELFFTVDLECMHGTKVSYSTRNPEAANATPGEWLTFTDVIVAIARENGPYFPDPSTW